MNGYLKASLYCLGIICLTLTFWAAPAFSGNLFFHKYVTSIETIDGEFQDVYRFNLTRQEDYQSCLVTKDEVCTKSETLQRDIYYTKYISARDVVSRGELNSRHIIHLSSSDEKLKTDPDYIGDSYAGMTPEQKNAVMIVEWETEEIDSETGETIDVRNHAKRREYNDRNRPERKIKKRIPGVYFGVSVK